MTWIRSVLALAILVAFLWLGGLFTFAAFLPGEPSSDGARTDAIVVLTGGSGRIETGVTLLQLGQSDRLFVSGVHQAIDLDEVLSHIPGSDGNLGCCVVLGYDAANTVGNAAETAAWARLEGVASIRLVTANYHLPRSLLEFHMAAPDIDVYVHPVVPSGVRLPDWWRGWGTTRLLVQEYNKFLVVLARYGVFRVLAPVQG